MAVRIVTDSTCDLPNEVRRTLNIEVVPLKVGWSAEEIDASGSATASEGYGPESDEFFDRIDREKTRPTLTDPKPAEFAAIYQRLANPDGIVSIHVSRGLSLTYQSAQRAANSLGRAANITVLDSGGISAVVGLVTIVAAEAAAAGKTADEVVAIAENAVEHVRTYVLVDNLDYVQPVTGFAKLRRLLGKLFALKPLITMRDGAIDRCEKVFTGGRAAKRVLARASSLAAVERIAMAQATDSKRATRLTDKLNERFPSQQVICCRLDPASAATLGPSAVVVALLKGSSRMSSSNLDDDGELFLRRRRSDWLLGTGDKSISIGRKAQ